MAKVKDYFMLIEIIPTKFNENKRKNGWEITNLTETPSFCCGL